MLTSGKIYRFELIHDVPAGHRMKRRSYSKFEATFDWKEVSFCTVHCLNCNDTVKILVRPLDKWIRFKESNYKIKFLLSLLVYLLIFIFPAYERTLVHYLVLLFIQVVALYTSIQFDVTDKYFDTVDDKNSTDHSIRFQDYQRLNTKKELLNSSKSSMLKQD